MGRHNDIALFIPCFNEEKRFKIFEIQNFIEDNMLLIDFYFIDDGSSDSTQEIILKYFVNGNINSNLISIEDNLGKGNALRCAVLKCAARPYLYFGFIDADMDIPFEQVNKLYYSLSNSDHLIGISFRSFKGKLRLRNYVSQVILKLSNAIIDFEKPLKDTQCGCKLFKKEMLFIFKEEFISRWLFDIEIFIRVKKSIKNIENNIIELPVENLGVSSASKIKFLHFPVIVKDILNITKMYKRRCEH